MIQKSESCSQKGEEVKKKLLSTASRDENNSSGKDKKERCRGGRDVSFEIRTRLIN